MLLEDDETRPRGCKYPTPPCALAKILPKTTVRAQFRQIENASPTIATFLTFSTNLLILVFIHAGNLRMPPRVLVQSPKPCGGKNCSYRTELASSALEVHTVQRFLARQKRTAPGPDGLPHWMWRDFSHLLAPVITKLFNCSLQEQFVPCHWKLANVTPIPKESPLTNCNQLRPISLTNIIIRLFEKVILKFELFHILKSLIGPDQFA